MKRRLIKKVSLTPIPEDVEGYIVDSENITDKTKNTYSARIIDSLLATLNVEIPAYYNYSTPVPDGTIDDLAVFTVGKPGMTGSVNITKKASGTGSEIPAGWYNFIAMPHRTGLAGEANTDNPNYGSIILTPMTFSGASWVLRRTSNTTGITEVKPFSNLSYSSFVVQSHAVSVSYSAYNSGDRTATLSKSGYYPLGIVSPMAYNYTQAGFTISPRRIYNRASGSCTISYWGKNDANGATSNCTAYIDVLWVKV